MASAAKRQGEEPSNASNGVGVICASDPHVADRSGVVDPAVTGRMSSPRVWCRDARRIYDDGVATLLNPYLNFDGTTREAMTFYHGVFGGDLAISTFGDFGAPEGVDPDGVMHAALTTESGLTLMASDLPPGQTLQAGNNFGVSLSGDDEVLRDYWEGLTADGQVLMPLERQPWGDDMGMCVDRFGTSWLVNISPASA